MEKKKTNKKWREIRSAVTMMCVMAAMLSSATFAWFTLTSSPTVSGMQMTAATESGLLVSATGTENSWFNAIALTESTESKQLKPVTPTTSGFCPPVYTGGTVTSLDTALDMAATEGYVAVYEFWMKPEGGTAVNVGLIGGANTQTDLSVNADHVAASSGTVVIEDGGSGDKNGAFAVRIGLLPENSNIADMIVIEPNSDGDFTTDGTAAPTVKDVTDTIAADFASDVKIKTNGDIEGTDPAGKISSKVLEVPAAGTKVTVYIWLEGTDKHCVNEIMADKLKAQLQFTVLSNT